MKRFVLAVMLSWTCAAAVHASDLEAGFTSPPDTARPHTWWHWINGNISKEGITKDLEAMRVAGIRGVQIFNVAMGPKGPVTMFTPEWHALFQHALQEASRLGLEVCLHNCPGWSSSGGPWTAPEHGMQMVVWAERQVEGPGPITEALPQPHTRKDYYRDIAVLAFPTPARERARLGNRSPVINAGAFAFSDLLFDGDPTTVVTVPGPERAETLAMDISLGAEPAEVSCLTMIAGPERYKICELQASNDGNTFRSLATFSTPAVYPVDWEQAQWQGLVRFPPTSARHFRLLFREPETPGSKMTIAELDLHNGYRIDGWPAKTAYLAQYLPGTVITENAPEDGVIPKKHILDITEHLQADGRLEWVAPEGDWTILRIGHTPTGRANHPAPPEGTGLECDKLSREAVNAHWDAAIEPLVQEVRELVPSTLNNILIDSYETGSQNWTPLFPEKFARLRGYEIGPWLVTLTGRVVEDLDHTERFLWDFRKTIADLWKEMYFGTFKERLTAYSMQLSIESYGNGVFDYLEGSVMADVPMTEFWASGMGGLGTTPMAASAAHLYAKPFVGAESFTSGPEAFDLDLYDLKLLGDRVFASGVNRYIFHSYVHQPDERAPGYTLGPFGTPFQRLNTWWDYMPVWTDYIARCQYLLQQGRFVADILYATGEAPAMLEAVTPYEPPPAGYSYDLCDAKTFLDQVSTRDGKIVLPSGMEYRLLVLPRQELMSVAMAKKLRALVKEGMAVIGTMPASTPGLEGYPESEKRLERLTRAIWGDALGGGKVVGGLGVREALEALDVAPDVRVAPQDAQVAWLHRQTEDADIYFVANQRRKSETIACSFRVHGKQPEIWRPGDGSITAAGIIREENGRTEVDVSLAPAESVFVVFRRPASAEHLVALTSPSAGRAGSRFEIVKAEYGQLLDPKSTADVTEKVAERVKDDVLQLTVGNDLFGDPAPYQVKQLRIEYQLDGQRYVTSVNEGAPVDLPESTSALSSPEVAPTEGGWQLTAWTPGTCAVESNTSQRVTTDIELPEPITLGGTWKVAFPLEAERKTMAVTDLESWTDFEEESLRDFSGTAQYGLAFNVDESLLRTDYVIKLDLGKVENFARIRVNGIELGALWKPPFVVDATAALRPGENTLEIEVTNLWINRLLADSKLPEAERQSWTTFNPFAPGKEYEFIFALGAFNKIEETPRPSGLLGPVRLVVGKRVRVSVGLTD